jgi:hypothetical protein
VMLPGSSGVVRDVALAHDMRGPWTGQVTMLVAGRGWEVCESNVRAALGTAVLLIGNSELELRQSGVGGVDCVEGSCASEAIWCTGRSECRCLGSAFAAARCDSWPLAVHGSICPHSLTGCQQRGIVRHRGGGGDAGWMHPRKVSRPDCLARRVDTIAR